MWSAAVTRVDSEFHSALAEAGEEPVSGIVGDADLVFNEVTAWGK